jgi:hypothetical protein
MMSTFDKLKTSLAEVMTSIGEDELEELDHAVVLDVTQYYGGTALTPDYELVLQDRINRNLSNDVVLPGTQLKNLRAIASDIIESFSQNGVDSYDEAATRSLLEVCKVLKKGIEVKTIQDVIYSIKLSLESVNQSESLMNSIDGVMSTIKHSASQEMSA